MSKAKKFNLLMYVYGRLFAQQALCNNCIGIIQESSAKIYSWVNILKWLQKEGYILEYTAKHSGKGECTLTYRFNRQKRLYEGYIRKIERNLKINSLAIEPTGDLVEEKNYDDFEAQYKKPVEYIKKEDRCVAELNQQIVEELEKSTTLLAKKEAA